MGKKGKKKKEPIYGTCEMCLEHKLLLRKSHIISGFLLRRILNPDNKGFSVFHVGDKKTRPVQDSAYEAGILCKNCDSVVIQKYEAYAMNLFFRGLRETDNYEMEQFQDYLEFRKINYQKLKLFVLSLIWRASISKQYSSLLLDSESQELLRNILLNNLAVKESDFPVFLFNYRLDGKEKGVILSPTTTTTETGTYFRFAAGGVCFVVCINDQVLYEPNKEYALNELGTVRVRPLSPETVKIWFNGHTDSNFF